LREIEGREEGSAPPVDLEQEKRSGDFVRRLIETGRLDTVHDISDGGLLIAVSEMCMAGGIGAALDAPEGIAFLFGEDQGRYIFAAPDGEAKAILREAKEAKVSAEAIGTSGGAELSAPGMEKVRIATLKAAHETWFSSYMSAS
jgi:phosphoribosylformylglycinamidine synthase